MTKDLENFLFELIAQIQTNSADNNPAHDTRSLTLSHYQCDKLVSLLKANQPEQLATEADRLLLQASEEIKGLRQHLSVQNGKLEMHRDFMTILNARASSNGDLACSKSENITWSIESYLGSKKSSMVKPII
jgi:hypothetical protein